MMWASCFSVVITVLFLSGETTSTSLEFDDCSDMNYITDNDKYYLTWNGGPLDSCKVTFRAGALFILSHKICVKATTWEIKNIDVSLKYFTSSATVYYSKKKEYTTLSLSIPTDEWCSDADEYVGIQLDTRNGDRDQGQIVLVVYTEEVDNDLLTDTKQFFDYSINVTAIVGGVIGGVVLLSIIGTIVAVIACSRRRASAGAVLNSTVGGNVLVCQTTQQTQGQWNTGYSAPQNYGVQPHSAPQGVTEHSNPQHYENGIGQSTTEGTTSDQDVLIHHIQV